MRELRSEIGSLHFAAEYPVSIHNTVSELTDFDFLIALIAMREGSYRELFKKEKFPNRYRIVDSGIFEDPDNPITTAEHIRTAEALEADEIVAIDLINDCYSTLKYMDELLAVSSSFPFKIQGVVQGRTLKEWLYCYKEMASNPRVDVIGLAYFDVPEDLKGIELPFGVPDAAEQARLVLLHLIAAGMGVDSHLFKEESGDAFRSDREHLVHKYSRFDLPRKPIHLLGIRHPRALRYYRQYPFIRSIDTSFPVQLGIEGRGFNLDSTKPKFRMNFKGELVRGELSLVAQNLMRFRELCRGEENPQTWAIADAKGKLL